MFKEGLTEFITLSEFASATFGYSETAWAILYSLALIMILVCSFSAGRRFFNINLSQLLRNNTDQLVYQD
jgi:hypothetical protein